MENKKLKIGLVLGGGFSRGSAQAGFLKGMLEYMDLEEISLMSCTSIGGINGIALTKGNLSQVEEIYKTLDLKNLKNLKINLKNKIVDDIIESICTDHNEIRVPLYVSGTQLYPWIGTHYFYIDKNSSYDYIRRCVNVTVTFPFVNGVFRKEFGRLYLDGGGTDNIPIIPFKYHEMDLIFILHCYPKYVPPQDMVYSNTVIIDVDIAARCDNSINTYSFEKENLNKMFTIGYAYGQEFGQKVLIDRDLNNIKERGQEFMRAELEVRKHKIAPLTAALFFNRFHHSRGFK